MKIDLSVVIITKNAEKTLGKVLAMLDFVDEIILVDSGSTDQTLSIGEHYKAKIFHQDWLGYGPQKKKAVSYAKNKWVLNLDADEVLTIDLKHYLKTQFLKDRTQFSGFFIPIFNIFMNRKLVLWGGSQESRLRLFNKELGNFDDLQVHESVHVQGTTLHLSQGIDHFSYFSIENYFEKFNLYTTNAAKELINQKKKPSILNALIRPPLKFVQLYFFRGCFRLGWPGFVWSFFSSIYPFVKYAKHIELYEQRKH